MFRKLFTKADYRFSDPENTACIVCSHVLSDNAPILRVTHDEEDGMWQFLCGAENHESDQPKIVALSEAASLDLTVNELHEMPIGIGAERESKNGPWQPFKL